MFGRISFALYFLIVCIPYIAISQNGIPPGDEGTAAVLQSSPRHGEYVDISFAGSEFAIHSWVVYPERSEQAPIIIVIHEIYGLTDWIRAVADQLANDGFIAIAPDFISGLGPDGGGTKSVDQRDEVVRLIRTLQPADVAERLNAVRRYALSIPAGNGKIATLGFCWGGAMSFYYATDQPDLDAAVVYYGTSPETERLKHVNAPVLGLYGEDDARVNVTIEPAAEKMEELGKTFEYHIFPGAGHGFLRAQSGREGANLKASEQAWKRTVEFLSSELTTR
jgi:carboxymethylenebutenolidase